MEPYLPFEINLLILRHLAREGCSETIRCYFAENESLKEQFLSRDDSSNIDNIRQKLRGPSVNGGLIEVLSDYGRAKILVNDLVKKLFEWKILLPYYVSPNDTLATQLVHITKLVESKYKQQNGTENKSIGTSDFPESLQNNYSTSENILHCNLSIDATTQTTDEPTTTINNTTPISTSIVTTGTILSPISSSLSSPPRPDLQIPPTMSLFMEPRVLNKIAHIATKRISQPNGAEENQDGSNPVSEIDTDKMLLDILYGISGEKLPRGILDTHSNTNSTRMSPSNLNNNSNNTNPDNTAHNTSTEFASTSGVEPTLMAMFQDAQSIIENTPISGTLVHVRPEDSVTKKACNSLLDLLETPSKMDFVSSLYTPQSKSVKKSDINITSHQLFLQTPAKESQVPTTSFQPSTSSSSLTLSSNNIHVLQETNNNSNSINKEEGETGSETTTTISTSLDDINDTMSMNSSSTSLKIIPSYSIVQFPPTLSNSWSNLHRRQIKPKIPVSRVQILRNTPNKRKAKLSSPVKLTPEKAMDSEINFMCVSNHHHEYTKKSKPVPVVEIPLPTKIVHGNDEDSSVDVEAMDDSEPLPSTSTLGSPLTTINYRDLESAKKKPPIQIDLVRKEIPTICTLNTNTATTSFTSTSKNTTKESREKQQKEHKKQQVQVKNIIVQQNQNVIEKNLVESPSTVATTTTPTTTKELTSKQQCTPQLETSVSGPSNNNNSTSNELFIDESPLYNSSSSIFGSVKSTRQNSSLLLEKKSHSTPRKKHVRNLLFKTPPGARSERTENEMLKLSLNSATKRKLSSVHLDFKSRKRLRWNLNDSNEILKNNKESSSASTSTTLNSTPSSSSTSTETIATSIKTLIPSSTILSPIPEVIVSKNNSNNTVSNDISMTKLAFQQAFDKVLTKRVGEKLDNQINKNTNKRSSKNTKKTTKSSIVTLKSQEKQQKEIPEVKSNNDDKSDKKIKEGEIIVEKRKRQPGRRCKGVSNNLNTNISTTNITTTPATKTIATSSSSSTPIASTSVSTLPSLDKIHVTPSPPTVSKVKAVPKRKTRQTCDVEAAKLVSVNAFALGSHNNNNNTPHSSIKSKSLVKNVFQATEQVSKSPETIVTKIKTIYTTPPSLTIGIDQKTPKQQNVKINNKKSRNKNTNKKTQETNKEIVQVSTDPSPPPMNDRVNIQKEEPEKPQQKSLVPSLQQLQDVTPENDNKGAKSLNLSASSSEESTINSSSSSTSGTTSSTTSSSTSSGSSSNGNSTLANKNPSDSFQRTLDDTLDDGKRGNSPKKLATSPKSKKNNNTVNNKKSPLRRILPKAVPPDYPRTVFPPPVTMPPFNTTTTPITKISTPKTIKATAIQNSKHEYVLSIPSASNSPNVKQIGSDIPQKQQLPRLTSAHFISTPLKFPLSSSGGSSSDLSNNSLKSLPTTPRFVTNNFGADSSSLGLDISGRRNDGDQQQMYYSFLTSTPLKFGPPKTPGKDITPTIIPTMEGIQVFRNSSIFDTPLKKQDIPITTTTITRSNSRSSINSSINSNPNTIIPIAISTSTSTICSTTIITSKNSLQTSNTTTTSSNSGIQPRKSTQLNKLLQIAQRRQNLSNTSNTSTSSEHNTSIEKSKQVTASNRSVILTPTPSVTTLNLSSSSSSFSSPSSSLFISATKDPSQISVQSDSFKTPMSTISESLKNTSNRNITSVSMTRVNKSPSTSSSSKMETKTLPPTASIISSSSRVSPRRERPSSRNTNNNKSNKDPQSHRSSHRNRSSSISSSSSGSSSTSSSNSSSKNNNANSRRKSSTTILSPPRDMNIRTNARDKRSSSRHSSTSSRSTTVSKINIVTPRKQPQKSRDRSSSRSSSKSTSRHHHHRSDSSSRNHDSGHHRHHHRRHHDDSNTKSTRHRTTSTSSTNTPVNTRANTNNKNNNSTNIASTLSASSTATLPVSPALGLKTVNTSTETTASARQKKLTEKEQIGLMGLLRLRPTEIANEKPTPKILTNVNIDSFLSSHVHTGIN